MGMTIDEATKIFRKEIECLSHTECEDCILEKVCDPIKTTPFDREYIEAYGMAIETMRKYQKIQNIINNTEYIEEDVIRYKMICEVIEDGNDD